MNNKITYHREGDYFIPDLYLPKQPEGHIGKYGQLRLNYLNIFFVKNCLVWLILSYCGQGVTVLCKSKIITC